MSAIESNNVESECGNNITIPSTPLLKPLKFEFPNAEALEFSYYTDTNYNEIRRNKLMLFSDCLGDTNADFTKQIYDTKTNNMKNNLMSWNIINPIAALITSYVINFTVTKKNIVKNLEKGALTRTITKSNQHNIRCIWTNPKFMGLYNDICYKIATNIDPQSSIKSNFIRNKLLTGEIKAYKVAKMTSKELCPVKYLKIDQKIHQRNNLQQNHKYSTLYKCKKCKRRQCKTERRYNRSLDEGVNLTIVCTFCHYEWCG